jgi:NADH-quinone oxidoreductase subunit M
VRRVLFGPITHAENQELHDLHPREWAVLVPLAILFVWIGCYPETFLSKVRPTLDEIVRLTETR